MRIQNIEGVLQYTTNFRSKQSYSVSLHPGKYRIECWGAQGAVYKGDGGRGAYVSGEIYISCGKQYSSCIQEKQANKMAE